MPKEYFVIKYELNLLKTGFFLRVQPTEKKRKKITQRSQSHTY